MPVVNIEFDDKKVSKKDIFLLSNAIHKIVLDTTKTEDVIVYANTSQIRLNIHPIEIFVFMREHKIDNIDNLVRDIKLRLIDWKKQSSFKHLINLTLAPMQWKIELGI